VFYCKQIDQNLIRITSILTAWSFTAFHSFLKLEKIHTILATSKKSLSCLKLH